MYDHRPTPGQLDSSAAEFDVTDLVRHAAELLGPQWVAEELADAAEDLGLSDSLPAIRCAIGRHANGRAADGFAITIEPLPQESSSGIEPLSLAACVYGDSWTTDTLLLPEPRATLAHVAAQVAEAVRALRAAFPLDATFPAVIEGGHDGARPELSAGPQTHPGAALPALFDYPTA
ncbi:hypothetical protein OG455_27825 [Kitasatospora sp. NBC_01287]|uniref:hypothetical protein n=1 Tax=Kitasatospora sp. NBC_01287 TaxID=2903573 RepID=UPI002258347F|nr:hypothetical protein [Kitasatospora sp. NBC_01287]MCX4749271.1 hypothetical protein [Kitasatospora sp. NBC_01287]